MKYYFIILLSISLVSCKPNKGTPVDIDDYGNIITEESEDVEPMYILNPKANLSIIWDENNEDFKTLIYKINECGHAIITMDSCEWIYFKIESHAPIVKHSPNCKFCKERNKNESIHID